jgi:hypothetical protein
MVGVCVKPAGSRRCDNGGASSQTSLLDKLPLSLKRCLRCRGDLSEAEIMVEGSWE